MAAIQKGSDLLTVVECALAKAVKDVLLLSEKTVLLINTNTPNSQHCTPIYCTELQWHMRRQ